MVRKYIAYMSHTCKKITKHLFILVERFKAVAVLGQPWPTGLDVELINLDVEGLLMSTLALSAFERSWSNYLNRNAKLDYGIIIN